MFLGYIRCSEVGVLLSSSTATGRGWFPWWQIEECDIELKFMHYPFFPWNQPWWECVSDGKGCASKKYSLYLFHLLNRIISLATTVTLKSLLTLCVCVCEWLYERFFDKNSKGHRTIEGKNNEAMNEVTRKCWSICQNCLKKLYFTIKYWQSILGNWELNIVGVNWVK